MYRKAELAPREGQRPTVDTVEQTLITKTRLTQSDLATRWSISPKTLERWRVLGIGPCYLKLCGKIVYRIEDIEEFELQSLRQSTQENDSPRGGA